MHWDPVEHRYFVFVFVFAEVEGRRTRLTISTVANDVLEMSFAHDLDLPSDRSSIDSMVRAVRWGMHFSQSEGCA